METTLKQVAISSWITELDRAMTSFMRKQLLWTNENSRCNLFNAFENRLLDEINKKLNY